MIDRISEISIARTLCENGFESAEFEARQIALAAENGEHANRMLEQRLQRRPLQYILGKWEFYGLPFKVGEGVLIPRADTEIVVETAIKLLNGRRGAAVLDVCAGSGCIGISLALKCSAKVTLLEKSAEALGYLKDNLVLNRVNADVLEQDLFKDGLGATGCDMIISNPPYIKTAVLPTLSVEVKKEPVMALDGGSDGLIFYKEITKRAKSALVSGGYLVFEIGFDQRYEVSSILMKNGFKNINYVKDYGGNDRVVYGNI